jgi:hypothetical protein
MAYKITFSHPGYDKDYPLDIRGLGLVKNGSSVTLDEDAESNFVQLTGMTVKDKLGNDEHFTVEGNTTLKKPEVDKLLSVPEVAEATPEPVEEVKN